MTRRTPVGIAVGLALVRSALPAPPVSLASNGNGSGSDVSFGGNAGQSGHGNARHVHFGSPPADSGSGDPSTGYCVLLNTIVTAVGATAIAVVVANQGGQNPNHLTAYGGGNRSHRSPRPPTSTTAHNPPAPASSGTSSGARRS